MKRLVADPRFTALSSRDARVLIVALVQYADGQGRWWTNHKTLAKAVGVSESTVERAIKGWTESALSHLVDPPRPLVTVEPWLRPPGARGGPQGSNSYTLDPTLVETRVSRADDPYTGSRTDDPLRLFSSEDPARNGRTDDPDRRSLIEDKIGASARADTPTTKPARTRGSNSDTETVWKKYIQSPAWDESFSATMMLDELRTRGRGRENNLTDDQALALWRAECDRRYPTPGHPQPEEELENDPKEPGLPDLNFTQHPEPTA